MIVTSSDRSGTASRDIKIAKIIGTEIAMSPDDGEKVRAKIEEALSQLPEEGGSIRLCFTGLSMVTTSFLNPAVGVLYGRYDNGLLSRTLSAPDASQSDKKLLQEVIRTAKQYYEDPDRYRRIVDSVLEED